MIIFVNGKIYPLDEKNSYMSAMAIGSGRILALGTDQVILAKYKERTTKQEIINLRGKTIIPGLVDGHIHLKQYAFALRKIDCETKTKSECLRRVAEKVRNSKPGEWILGHGWNQNDWIDGFGSKEDLDQIAPQNPVYLTAKSLHAGWVNSLALRIANVDSDTPSPPGGNILLNALGEPSGILTENAMQLVSHSIPVPSPESIVSAIEKAIHTLSRFGITGVHDFDRRDSFVALQKLHEEKHLNIRVIKSIPAENLDHAIALGLRTGFGDDFLRIGSLKIFADGALGPHTAAMLRPYEGESENRGVLLLDAEQLYEIGVKAIENSISLAVHAIGDLANHEVLKAYIQLRRYEEQMQLKEKSFHINGSDTGRRYRGILSQLRHRIEHVQLIHSDDASLLSRFGIIASMQPIHATSDMLMADMYWGERTRLAYAWRTQLEHNAHLVFGSDAPVDSPNPFWGIHAAVTRRRQDGTPGVDGWINEQRLSVFQTLRAYTSGAAFAAGMENRTGKLRPGFYADLVVLDVDPFTCNVDDLWRIMPRGTMLEGKWTFLADDFF